MRLLYIGIGILSTLYFKDDKIKSMIDNFSNEVLQAMKGQNDDKTKS